ncbi:MAG: DUF1405 domain-containing protein [Peptococcaceae bacterium]|nr:DUF1405 domain-containing protein [Peptococcaceae bacterium]
MVQVYRLWRDFWHNPWQGRFMVPLVIINAAGSAYGFYWYHEQLARTPYYFWPFVPDSPLSTTLFALALLLSLAGPGRLLFQTVALTASIKYGIWAMVMISHYWLMGGPLEFTEGMLWVSHLGMALQGFIYLKTLQPGRGVILFTACWMTINDLMDYGLNLHPDLFAPGQRGLALVTAAGLTLTITAGLALGRWFKAGPAGSEVAG